MRRRRRNPPPFEYVDEPREQDRRRRELMEGAIRMTMVEPQEAGPAELTIVQALAEAANDRNVGPKLDRWLAADVHPDSPRPGGMRLMQTLIDTLHSLHPDTVEYIWDAALRAELMHERERRSGHWGRSNPCRK